VFHLFPHTMNKIKGYTTIEIGGKKRPVHFGINQSEVYKKLRGLSQPEYIQQIADLKDTNDTGVMRDLLYSGLVAGAEYDDAEVDFTEKKVGFWLEEVDESELAKAFETMIASNGPNEKAPKAEATAGQS
jgi:hypothetical protein